jgi:hypothetical protein
MTSDEATDRFSEAVRALEEVLLAIESRDERQLAFSSALIRLCGTVDPGMQEKLQWMLIRALNGAGELS